MMLEILQSWNSRGVLLKRVANTLVEESFYTKRFWKEGAILQGSEAVILRSVKMVPLKSNVITKKNSVGFLWYFY